MAESQDREAVDGQAGAARPRGHDGRHRLGYQRIARAAAHGSGAELVEAGQAARILLPLSDQIAALLDNKPAGQVQAPVFVFSGQDPNREVPPDAGQPKLSPAEDEYEEVREEDAPGP